MPEISPGLARRPAALRALGINLLLALVYYLSARVGLLLVPDDSIIAAIWPPRGLALAALLILGVWVWPGILLGALAAALVFSHLPLVALSLTVGGTGAALLGWWLLRRLGFNESIRRVRDVWYLLITAAVTGIICPSVGCPALAMAGKLRWQAVPSSWIEWSCADITGILLVTPLLLAWTRPANPKPGHGRVLPFLLFLLAVGLVSLLTFPHVADTAEPRYLLLSTIFPLLIWGSLQFGQRETILAAAVVSMTATFAWRHGRVAFPDGVINEPKLVIDLFSAEIVATAMLLGAISSQRRRAHDELERRVAERTAQLERSNEEKEILLKEIHHRVKNNMQVICSLLNLEARSFADTRLVGAFADSQHRVKSMALVHEHLYQSQTLGRISMPTYVRALVDGVAGSQSHSARVRCDLDCEDITMPIDTAVPCGLIINEIVTNVFKHAFPDGRDGHLMLTMKQSTPGRIELTVSDDGVGLPPAQGSLSGSSFGMRLISMLVEQLQATLEILPTAGTTLRLLIPHEAGSH